MDYIGIIFLALLLIYFINGLRKGFIVNLLESIKTIAVLILAFVFCKPIGKSLMSSGMLDKLGEEMVEYASAVIGFLAIMFFGSIILSVIIFIVKKLANDPDPISRILGGLVGIVRALITIGIYCYFIGFIYELTPESAIGTFINNSLNSEVGIFKFFFNHNLIDFILDNIIK